MLPRPWIYHLCTSIPASECCGCRGMTVTNAIYGENKKFDQEKALTKCDEEKNVIFLAIQCLYRICKMQIAKEKKRRTTDLIIFLRISYETENNNPARNNHDELWHKNWVYACKFQLPVFDVKVFTIWLPLCRITTSLQLLTWWVWCQSSALCYKAVVNFRWHFFSVLTPVMVDIYPINCCYHRSPMQSITSCVVNCEDNSQITTRKNSNFTICRKFRC